MILPTDTPSFVVKTDIQEGRILRSIVWNVVKHTRAQICLNLQEEILGYILT